MRWTSPGCSPKLDARRDWTRARAALVCDVEKSIDLPQIQKKVVPKVPPSASAHRSKVLGRFVSMKVEGRATA